MQKRAIFLKQFLKKAVAVTLSASLICGMGELSTFAAAAQSSDSAVLFDVAAQSADQSAEQTADQSIEQSADQSKEQGSGPSTTPGSGQSTTPGSEPSIIQSQDQTQEQSKDQQEPSKEGQQPSKEGQQPSSDDTKVQELRFITENNQTIVEGKTLQLKYAIYPSNAKVESVQWKSDDESVARVDKTGLVTALKPGKATITLQISDKTATYNLTVEKEKIPVNHIEVQPKKYTILLDQTLQLKAKVLPENADNKNVIWKVEKVSEKVATVTSDGLVTPIATGTALVTAETEDGGFTDMSVITVTTADHIIALEDVSFKEKEKTVLVNDKFSLTPQFTPYNATNQELSWESDNHDTAIVENGEVIALAPGQATITAKSIDGIHKASCVVTVEEPVVKAEDITLDKSTKTLSINGKVTIKATVDPEETTNKAVKFSSSNSKIVKIDKKDETKGTATLKAVAGGVATITVKSKENDKLKATITVIVKPTKATNVKKNSVKKTSFKTSWKKCSGASGYEISVTNKKTGKTVLKKKTSKTSYTVSKLKKGTSYRVKVRAYVKAGSKTEYGSWSSTITATTDK